MKVSQARLPVECARWQRLCGICLLGVDELQFMAASDTATTLITQTMLAIAEVRIPWFVTANYSLARKLLSRPSEAIQRLLGIQWLSCLMHQDRRPGKHCSPNTRWC